MESAVYSSGEGFQSARIDTEDGDLVCSAERVHIFRAFPSVAGESVATAVLECTAAGPSRDRLLGMYYAFGRRGLGNTRAKSSKVSLTHCPIEGWHDVVKISSFA